MSAAKNRTTYDFTKVNEGILLEIMEISIADGIYDIKHTINLVKRKFKERKNLYAPIVQNTLIEYRQIIIDAYVFALHYGPTILRCDEEYIKELIFREISMNEEEFYQIIKQLNNAIISKEPYVKKKTRSPEKSREYARQYYYRKKAQKLKELAREHEQMETCL